jgi:hypothetical protein
LAIPTAGGPAGFCGVLRGFFQPILERIRLRSIHHLKNIYLAAAEKRRKTPQTPQAGCAASADHLNRYHHYNKTSPQARQRNQREITYKSYPAGPGERAMVSPGNPPDRARTRSRDGVMPGRQPAQPIHQGNVALAEQARGEASPPTGAVLLCGQAGLPCGPRRLEPRGDMGGMPSHCSPDQPAHLPTSNGQAHLPAHTTSASVTRAGNAPTLRRSPRWHG